jgi:hypothetical protein
MRRQRLSAEQHPTVIAPQIEIARRLRGEPRNAKPDRSSNLGNYDLLGRDLAEQRIPIEGDDEEVYNVVFSTDGTRTSLVPKTS